MAKYPGQGVLDMRTGPNVKWRQQQWWQPQNMQYTPMLYNPPPPIRPLPLQVPGPHHLHPTPTSAIPHPGPPKHFPTCTTATTDPQPQKQPAPKHPPTSTIARTDLEPQKQPETPTPGPIPPPTPISTSVPSPPADQRTPATATSPPPQSPSAEFSHPRSRKRLNRQQIIQLVEICLSKKKFWGQIPFKDFWAQVTTQFMKVSGTKFTGCAARMSHMVKSRYAWIASHGGEVRQGMEMKDEVLDGLMDQWIEYIEAHQKQLEGKRSAALGEMTRRIEDNPILEQGALKRKRIHEEFCAPIASCDNSSGGETAEEEEEDVEFHEAPEEPDARRIERAERRAAMQAVDRHTPTSQFSASLRDRDKESNRKRRKLMAPKVRTGNRLTHLEDAFHALAEGIIAQAKEETDSDNVKVELAALRDTVEDQRRQIEALSRLQEKQNTLLESLLASFKKKDAMTAEGGSSEIRGSMNTSNTI